MVEINIINSQLLRNVLEVVTSLKLQELQLRKINQDLRNANLKLLDSYSKMTQEKQENGK